MPQRKEDYMSTKNVGGNRKGGTDAKTGDPFGYLKLGATHAYLGHFKADRFLHEGHNVNYTLAGGSTAGPRPGTISVPPGFKMRPGRKLPNPRRAILSPPDPGPGRPRPVLEGGGGFHLPPTPIRPGTTIPGGGTLTPPPPRLGRRKPRGIRPVHGRPTMTIEKGGFKTPRAKTGLRRLVRALRGR